MAHPRSGTSLEVPRIIPQPSPSMLAMQAQGLELPFRHNDLESPTEDRATEMIEMVLGDDMYSDGRLPGPSYVSAGSSIYSTDSVDSSDSVDSMASLQTSISQIIEMYTNLVDKIAYDDEPYDPPLLQPMAYRDTVAPLLVKRFSSDRLATAPTVSITPADSGTQKSYTSELRSTSEQAPAFQDFFRNLRNNRAQLESYCSVSTGDELSYQPTLSDVSEPSPVSAPGRPWSFVDDQLDDVGSKVDKFRSVSPVSTVDHDAEAVATRVPSRGEMVLHLASPEPSLRQVGSRAAPLRYINHEDLQKLRAKTLRDSEQSDPRSGSERYYRKHSTDLGSGETQTMRGSLGEAVKAMVKDKIKRRQEPSSSPISGVGHMSNTKPPPVETLSSRSERQEPRPDTEDCMQEAIYFTVNHGDNSATLCHHTARLSTHSEYSELKQEGDACVAKSEFGYTNKRPHSQDAIESNVTSSRCLLLSHGHEYNQRHRGTSSSQITSTTTANLPQGKKHSILSVFEGAKQSLTQSSAEKRRGKLKQSITLVGPTDLTTANALPNGRISPSFT